MKTGLSLERVRISVRDEVMRATGRFKEFEGSRSFRVVSHGSYEVMKMASRFKEYEGCLSWEL